MIDSKVPKLLRKYWKWKYATILVMLFLGFIVIPILGFNASDAPTLRIGELGVLMCCLLATARNRQVMVVAMVLALSGEIFGFFWPEGRQLCQIFFFFCVAGVVLIDVMRPEEVTADKMLGAVCGYILVAYAFAIVFAVVEALQPNSLRTENSDFQSMLYYSIVTISTLGYGDIVPLSGPARALASLEAVIGQFYIAIIVARLVSLHQAGVQGRTNDGTDR